MLAAGSNLNKGQQSYLRDKWTWKGGVGIVSKVIFLFHFF